MYPSSHNTHCRGRVPGHVHAYTADMPTITDPSVTLRRGDLAFRPATLDDAAFAADVATASRPDEPEDAASWRHWVVYRRPDLDQRALHRPPYRHTDRLRAPQPRPLGPDEEAVRAHRLRAPSC